MLGARLSQLVDFESLKLSAGTVLLSPYVPLLFMGEEYAEDAPFLYFVSHTDEQLIAAVCEGRRTEFEAFQWQQECPNPQAVETFQKSKLDWEKRGRDRHRLMLDFYRQLLSLRRGIPRLVSRKGLTVDCLAEQNVLIWHRKHPWGQVHGLMNFSPETQQVRAPVQRTTWVKVLDSAGAEWGGPGATLPDSLRNRQEVTLPARSFAVFQTGAAIVEQEKAEAETVVAATGESADANPVSHL